MLSRCTFTRSPFSLTGKRFFNASVPGRQMTDAQRKIVKSTAPVLAQHGIAITTHFYNRVLTKHPELKNIFNSAHQDTGAQPAALAHAVWAYASNIDNLGALKSAVSRIGHKHASLGVTPEQYPIVGANLLASIKEVLGDAADESILDAWKAAYGDLADIFINFERGLYEEAAKTPGGWNGWRKFIATRKVRESDEIVSFHLTPADGGALPKFQPGQYVSVRCFVPKLGVYQPRQYSLSAVPNQKYFRISVKRESASSNKPAGRISNVLHESLPEQAELDVSMPYGDFTLDLEKDTPVVLISGGVGLTPMMSMLQTVVEQGKDRRIVFVHAVRDRKVHAMKDYLSQIMQENPQISRAIYYEQVTDADVKGVDYDFKGRIDLRNIKDVAILPDADYYLCGPLPFMNAQSKALEEMGVSKDRIHSEIFGSTTG